MALGTGELPEHGRLRETPLPRLLLGLAHGRFGGALTLSRERVVKRVLFQAGAPVFAESSLASESLTAQLRESGALAAEDAERVRALVASRGRKEAAALLELGLLGTQELFAALRRQLRARVVECFGWPDGEFSRDPGAAPPADAAPFRTEAVALVQAGIAAHWPSDRILVDLGPRMEAYVRPGKRFDATVARLDRDPAVDGLLAAVDGSLTLWQVVQAAPIPSVLATAWVLDACGAFAYADAPGAGDEGPREPITREIEIVVTGGAAEAAAARPAKAAHAPARSRNEQRARELAEEIQGKYAKLADLDAYEVLGVAPNASQADVKRAYLKAAKAYHPDALSRLGLDAALRAQANKVFGEIGKAHAVLADPRRRKEYDSSLATASTDFDAERLAQAEMNYRKAEVLLRVGNFKGALDFLKPAVDLWPEECAYQSALGWCLYKKRPPEPERAREVLERAAALDPNDAETWRRLAIVLRELGETEAAEDAGQRAERRA